MLCSARLLPRVLLDFLYLCVFTVSDVLQYMSLVCCSRLRSDCWLNQKCPEVSSSVCEGQLVYPEVKDFVQCFKKSTTKRSQWLLEALCWLLPLGSVCESMCGAQMMCVSVDLWPCLLQIQLASGGGGVSVQLMRLSRLVCFFVPNSLWSLRGL